MQNWESKKKKRKKKRPFFSKILGWSEKGKQTSFFFRPYDQNLPFVIILCE